MGALAGILVILAVLGGWLAAGAGAAGCTDTYTGSGDWSSATSWSTGKVPSSTDVACWGSTETLTVTVAGEEADSVQGGGLSIKDGGGLQLASSTNASSVRGLTVAEGTLNGASGSTLSVLGDFDWNVAGGKSSTINGQGGVAISQTGSHSFTIEGSGSETISHGSLSTPNAVSITNTKLASGQNGGPSLKTDSTITLAAGTYGGAEFPMTAAGVITGGAVSSPYSLDLTGDASSLGGSLTLTKLSIETAGKLTVPSGDTVSAGGGTISGTVDGAGTFDQRGAATTVASGASLTPSAVTTTVGQLAINTGASYSTDSTTIQGGGLEVDATGATTGPLTVTSGDLYGSGKLTVAGNFDWNVASGDTGDINVRNPISLTVAQTGSHTFQIRGSGTEQMSGGTLTTPDPVSITNTKLASGNFPGPSLKTDSAITFAAGTYSGGTFTMTAAGIVLPTGATSTPYTLDLTGGGTTVESASSLSAAQVNESGGTLQVDGTLTSPVELSGGTLKGRGEVNGAVSNDAGTLAAGDSPGTLTITGDYTQGSSGTLAEEITGTTPGTQFDQLVVGGDLTLGGTLAIDSHTFTPAATDTFKVIKGAASRSGTFAHVTGATVKDVSYSEQDDSDGVTLTVTAPPPPSKSSPPTVSGNPSPGQTLTCNNGSWTNSPTSFAYQWNQDGSPLPGATSQTYDVQLSDQGHALNCMVTASNGGGAGTPATSAAVNVPSASQPPPKNAPANTSPPAVRGTPLIGQNVFCDPGSWTHSPTGFAFQWNQNGMPIPGATGDTVNVPPVDADDITGAADEDDFLTCTVVASNSDGAGAPVTSAPVNMIPPSPAVRPVNTTPPTISGTPLPGQHLLCSPGHWSESPGHFGFQWTRNGHDIPPANGGSYIVKIADRGHAVACRVTAVNVAGSSQPATSAGVPVAQAGTLQCPQPTGFMHSQSIGPLTLGMTRQQARTRLPLRTTRSGGIDDFCLFGGWDIEAGYPSRQLLNTLSPRIARKLNRHVVILLTGNPFYALAGVQPGATLQAVRNLLHPRVPERIGSTGWYFVSRSIAIQIFEVKNGVVQQVGLADDRLTTTRAARQQLIESLHL